MSTPREAGPRSALFRPGPRRAPAPRHTLLPMAFRIIPINRITRQITENGTVIPDGPKIARKARFVIQDALENGTFPSSIEMALTKLVSNFNYLWGWTRFQDKQLEVTVGLLNEMMAVLKEHQQQLEEEGVQPN
ncbi:hypothetical protein SMACR_07490 [Sordaria macrospora]|uniref:WGS project CABT00000000 data, contig 2.46 n=2 Tax=Sordaria macrospora TaxID=5147 RepID=F7W8R8_SORMK|nr:uncharacterized protein SMAC_07490 [Sordaria macrospora k-hell]KAA8632549.1 hypothetical protein SMACR_07490 [Sordaria macrospora]WPJ65463.1 hypothetical protein SMAC4_07490 [Sordaria macrospora]CCC13854.1 unnamed protein product [Sordaria macrospora k-hell]